MRHTVWFSELPLGRPLHGFAVATDNSEQPTLRMFLQAVGTAHNNTSIHSLVKEAALSNIKPGEASSNVGWLFLPVTYSGTEGINSEKKKSFKKNHSFKKVLFQKWPLRIIYDPHT